MSRSRGDKVFDIANTVFMLLLLLVTFYPLYYTVIASLSEPFDVARGNVRFLPVNFTLQSYRQVFAYSQIWIGYRNTIFYTVFGTLFSLFLTIPAAYTLSKKQIPFRGVITFFFVFTMYFGGGMIPTFLLVRDMGLMNTPWVMIILGGFSVWNMIVTRVYFMSSIPEELYESARIDGASDFRQFFTIALPLAKPVIAVITLWYIVGNWNAFFNALLYIRDANLEPLQLVLRRVLVLEQSVLDEGLLQDTLQPGELLDRVRRAHAAYTMRYAMVFIASFPLLVAYPFIQKHFVKGIMVGSLKG
ncbi:MAG: carbohydrate ABC transporter permease [Defluviitaleaceae bacterium]|nr:carbohydrate ABC transporter permease [Defluviitaleaceae bacterium]